MKKLYAIALLAAASLSPLTVSAQTEEISAEEEIASLKAELKAKNDQEKYNEIWSRHKTFDLAYISTSWKPQHEKAFPSNYGFALRLGNSYWLNKKPIAGMIKIGLDAVWMDLNYVNLKGGQGANINPNDYFEGSDEYDDYFDSPIPNLPSEQDMTALGSHMLEFNMGVGPSIHVSPFAKLDNQAKYLRASLYCHFSPGFSAVLVNYDESTQFNCAFVPYVTFGGSIQWKALRIFCEGRWGSANYKMGKIKSGDTDFDMTDQACKSNMVRFGFGLCY